MENKSAIWGNSITYGLITGFASIIYSILLYILDLTFNRGLSSISLIILLLGIFFGTKVLRDKYEGGIITYGRALASGVIIVFVAAILGAVFNYILNVYIDPGLAEKGFQFMEQKFIEQGRLTEDQIEMFMERAREKSSPIKTSLWSIPWIVFVGFIISLITSAFIKKDQQPAV